MRSTILAVALFAVVGCSKPVESSSATGTVRIAAAASVKPALEEIESQMICEYFPIINTDDNPKPVSELAKLRRECRTHARKSP